MEPETDTGGSEDDESEDDDDSEDDEPEDDESGDTDDPDHDPDAEEDEPCASLSEAAALDELPADIIFVVDNSGSMDAEAQFVRDQMNGFSSQIHMSGVDYHVVLLSDYPGYDTNGICIDPPLGGGGCPAADDNLPVYRHVDVEIESHDSLEKLLETHAQWKGSMRPNSKKHVVVITDDESDMPAEAFRAQFVALDPSYESFLFHAIVCPWECEESDGIGAVYMTLVEQTGGVLGDLCKQDFQTVFDELAKSVIQNAPLSCQFEIPPPPMGMTLDPNLVNVEIGDGNNLVEIPRVMDATDCMNHPDGWYYDDPVAPTQIFLCPQTCEQLQGYAMGTINVKFGCETYTPIG